MSKVWDIKSADTRDEWNLRVTTLTDLTPNSDTFSSVSQILFKEGGSTWASCTHVPYQPRTATTPEIKEHLGGTHSSGKNFMILRDSAGNLTCDVWDEDGEGPVLGWTALEGAG